MSKRSSGLEHIYIVQIAPTIFYYIQAKNKVEIIKKLELKYSEISIKRIMIKPLSYFTLSQFESYLITETV